MPADRKPRLSPAEQQSLERWIKYDVFAIDPANPDPGRVTVRRLNRVEYRNTVRDLLGVDYNTDHEFPPDDSGFGFDNIGDALTMSPMLMEKYVAAAQAVIAEAVPTAPRKPAEAGRQGHGFDGKNATLKWGERQLVFNEPANVSASFKNASARQLSREARPRGQRQLHAGSRPRARHLQGRRQGSRATRNLATSTRRPSRSSPRTSGNPPSTRSPSNSSPRCPRGRRKPSSICSSRR